MKISNSPTQSLHIIRKFPSGILLSNLNLCIPFKSDLLNERYKLIKLKKNPGSLH